MDKIVAVWTGWAGGPGFSNFYLGGNSDLTQLNAAADRISDFFSQLAPVLPNSISITVQPGVQRLASASGEVIDEIALTEVLLPQTGVGGADFSAPSGACIVWRSLNSVGGRVVKGKTFLVPLASAAYDTDGTLDASALGSIRAAIAQLMANQPPSADGKLVVWHRPVNGAGGSEHTIVSGTVSDRAAILRSRRA